MTSKISKIAVLSISMNNNHYLNYWERENSPKKTKINKICSILKKAHSIELRSDESILFIGGSTETIDGFSFPVISALDFSRFTDQGEFLELSSHAVADPTMKSCLKIQRVEVQGKEDILFVSGDQHVVVLEYVK